MKVKILSLLLSVTLFFFAAVPARASSGYDSGQFIDLIDFGFSMETNSNFRNFTVSGDMTYTLPSALMIGYVDILFTYTGPAISEVNLLRGGSSYADLTFVKIDNFYYRAYGTVRDNIFAEVGVQFVTNSSSYGYVTIQSFKIAMPQGSSSDITGFCEISSNHYNQVIHYVPTDEVNYRTWTDSGDYDESAVSLFIYTEEWEKYDFIDIFVHCTISSITSVAASFNGEPLPFELSYLDNTNASDGGFTFHIRLDLTEVDRTFSDYPIVYIEGVLHVQGINQVAILGMNGLVQYYQNNSVMVWLRNIYLRLNSVADRITSKLDSVIDAINGDTSSGNSFQESVEDEINELDQAADIMDSVSRPDINGIDISMDQYASAADLAVLTAPVSLFFEIDLFKSILIMSILFATVSFVLFGKR